MGKKKRRRNGGSILKTAYKLLPVGALAAPAIGIALGNEPPNKKLAMGVRAYTGYTMPNMGLGTPVGFQFHHLAQGWTPFIVTSLMVFGIQKLRGIIRRM